MRNRFFTRSMLDLLMQPERWTLVNAKFPCAVKPVRDPRHAAWSRKHTHTHDRVEVLFVFSGRGGIGYRGKVYPLRPGMVFFFAPQEAHDSALPEGTTVEDDLLIEIYRDRYIARLFDLHGGFRQPWARLFVPEELRISPEAFFPQPGLDEGVPARVRRASLLSALALLTSALVERGYCPNALRERKEDFQREIIGAIEKHMRETVGRPNSIEALARMAGYSKYHFLRMFKQHTGKTVHQYVDACRALRASEMLAQGALKRDISRTLGFAHSSALTRWLRSHRLGRSV